MVIEVTEADPTLPIATTKSQAGRNFDRIDWQVSFSINNNFQKILFQVFLIKNLVVSDHLGWWLQSGVGSHDKMPCHWGHSPASSRGALCAASFTRRSAHQ